MNSCYKILKTSNRLYPCIVFSMGYINPMDQKEAIEKDLREIGIKGKVLFDLLLSHGNTPDRFFEASFNGEEISEESLKSIESISRKIKEISSAFYYTQQDFLENSVLSRAQKFLIKKKLPLRRTGPKGDSLKRQKLCR